MNRFVVQVRMTVRESGWTVLPRSLDISSTRFPCAEEALIPETKLISPLSIDRWQVFEDIGAAVVDQAFSGFNSTVFAYGQVLISVDLEDLRRSGRSPTIPRISVDFFCH